MEWTLNLVEIFGLIVLGVAFGAILMFKVLEKIL